MPGGLLLVLEDELLNVLAALEQLLPVLHLEHRLRPVLPSLARDRAHRTQRLRVDLHLVGDGLAAELPVGFGGWQCGDDRSVVQEDIGEQFVLIQQSQDIEQVLAGQALAVLGQALSHLLHLRLVRSAIDRNELAADLHLLELGSEGGSVDEESLLVESSAQGPERCLGVGAAALVLLE